MRCGGAEGAVVDAAAGRSIRRHGDTAPGGDRDGDGRPPGTSQRCGASTAVAAPRGSHRPLPRHLNASGKWWLAASGGVVLAWVVVAVTGSTWLFDVADTRVLQALAQLRSAPLTRVALAAGALATPVAVYVLWVTNLVILLALRRWRHLFVWIGVALVVVNFGATMLATLQRPRPYEVELIGRWAGFSMPSLPMTVLATFLVSTLYSLVPAGRPRTMGKWVVGAVLAVTALSRLYLAQDHPTDIVAGVILGVAVPAGRVPAAHTQRRLPGALPPRAHRAPRRHRCARATRSSARCRTSSACSSTSVKPFNLAGSGGSTPLRIAVKSDDGRRDTYVFGKLYAATHVRSDRWYKLGRTLLYGRLEDEKPFHSVRRLVQYEDYVLRLLHDAGLPVSRPLGIVEITPEREYLLVTEFIDGAREIGEAEVDEAVIDQGLSVVRRMWEIGLAHRDIKPANLLVRDGTLFAHRHRVRRGAAQPVAAGGRPGQHDAGPGAAHRRRAGVRAGPGCSSPTRRSPRPSPRPAGSPCRRSCGGCSAQQGRDLHAQFLQLLPYRLPPVRIQLWSWRRVVLTIATLFGALLARADHRPTCWGNRCEAAPRSRGGPGSAGRRCCSPAAPATRPPSPSRRCARPATATPATA